MASITDRQKFNAVMHYESCDGIPMYHFGFWHETLQKWATEGYVTEDQACGWSDGNETDFELSRQLGFDCNYTIVMGAGAGLKPAFESKVIKELPDGSQHVVDANGAVVLVKPGTVSIPAEIDHLLKDRQSWEEHYKWRLQYSSERFANNPVKTNTGYVSFSEGGCEFLKDDTRDWHYGLHVGSLFGTIRNYLGVENSAYLAMDDPDLFTEIIDTNANLCYRLVEDILKTGAKFDFLHYWEDICFKNGPLIAPSTFAEYVAPHYRKISDLAAGYGIDIISLDCDGLIDSLVPIWLENGVNTMFPIEVGTWGASIAPWREKYGRDIRGVGGMNKTVFAYDRSAIDAEVERLKPLVDLGGYIPCPDHRIAPDAKYDNVRYYCDKMQITFGE